MEWRIIIFPWCVCEGKERRRRCVCVWGVGVGGGGVGDEVFTGSAAKGKYSIYTCTFRKITSSISPSQSNNLFHSLFYIQYITHNDLAYYTWLFIREEMYKRNHQPSICQRDPSFRFTHFAGQIVNLPRTELSSLVTERSMGFWPVRHR